MKSNKLRREPKYDAKFKAFPYQQEAIDAVKDLEYAAIFHEQGLGKTKIAIDILLYWLSKCSMDTVLIVTKKQLVANWINEFKDHTSIRPAILNTDKNNNYRTERIKVRKRTRPPSSIFTYRCLLALTTRVRLHRTTSAAFVHVCSRCKHLIC